MAGCVFGIVNRALIGSWSISTGTAVTGYPINNLNDASAGNQAQVTPSTATVILICDLGAAPSSSTNTDWAINSFGLANANLDGATVEVQYNTTSSVPTTGTNQVWTKALDANMGNPNLLVTFSAVSYRYWFIRITTAPTTTKIGVVHLGFALDFGDPAEGWQDTFSPTTGGQTGTGTTIITRFVDPAIVKQFQFDDPSVNVKTQVDSKAVANATTFPTYATLRRMLSKAKQTPINATTTVAGLSAGAGIPMLYHEGTARGISSAGRPAFYGLASFGLTHDGVRPTASSISVSVLDMNDANNVDVQPPTN